MATFRVSQRWARALIQRVLMAKALSSWRTYALTGADGHCILPNLGSKKAFTARRLLSREITLCMLELGTTSPSPGFSGRWKKGARNLPLVVLRVVHDR